MYCRWFDQVFHPHQESYLSIYTVQFVDFVRRAGCVWLGREYCRTQGRGSHHMVTNRRVVDDSDHISKLAWVQSVLDSKIKRFISRRD